MDNKPAARVESIKDGLAKLIREIGQLKAESAEIRRILDKFEHKNPIPKTPYYDRRDMGKTREPLTALAIIQIDTTDSQMVVSTIKAIRADLYGALQDIRSARIDIDSIAGDAYLRDPFKRGNW